jgi:hypothetical protein
MVKGISLNGGPDCSPGGEEMPVLHVRDSCEDSMVCALHFRGEVRFGTLI